jgi:hypothetical protein
LRVPFVTGRREKRRAAQKSEGGVPYEQMPQGSGPHVFHMSVLLCVCMCVCMCVSGNGLHIYRTSARMGIVLLEVELYTGISVNSSSQNMANEEKQHTSHTDSDCFALVLTIALLHSPPCVLSSHRRTTSNLHHLLTLQDRWYRCTGSAPHGSCI